MLTKNCINTRKKYKGRYRLTEHSTDNKQTLHPRNYHPQNPRPDTSIQPSRKGYILNMGTWVNRHRRKRKGKRRKQKNADTEEEQRTIETLPMTSG